MIGLDYEFPCLKGTSVLPCLIVERQMPLVCNHYSSLRVEHPQCRIPKHLFVISNVSNAFCSSVFHMNGTFRLLNFVNGAAIVAKSRMNLRK